MRTICKIKDCKKVKIGVMLTLLLVSTITLGCIGGEKETKEKKLEVTEGMGIIGSIKVDDLNPGLDGYISLTLRNNLGGAKATNVVLALDNVYPFEIYECGTSVKDASKKRSNMNNNCKGHFALDKDLPVRKHGLKQISPGQEVNPYWRLKAPSKDEISNIAVEHPIYWTMEYTYSLNFHENIVFMSQNEYLRRKDSNETTEVSGEAGMSAGALRISGSTDQPIMFVYDYPNDLSANESGFSFSTSYKIENQGKGFPISDIVLVAEIPDDVTITDSANTSYKWSCWENFSENCYRYNPKEDKYNNSNCSEWINDSSKELYDNAKKTSGDCKYIARKIENENFLEEFFIYAPLRIKGGEMKDMKKNNIPTKMYTFKIYSVYRYLIGGKKQVTVYPLKIY